MAAFSRGEKPRTWINPISEQIVCAQKFAIISAPDPVKNGRLKFLPEWTAGGLVGWY
jgi:hypothetical protein